MFQRFAPVIYRAMRPPLYDDVRDFIEESLFGDRDVRYKAILEKIIYAKKLNWQHEREYRLAIPLAPGERPWDTLPYHQEEITELYLGAAMIDTDKKYILNLAKSVNPKIAVFQAEQRGNGKVSFTVV